ncbi:hypothetical protein ACWGJ9_11120 [Curtobacterium citreum]
MTLASLDATVELTVRDLLTIRSAAVLPTPLQAAYPDDNPTLRDDEYAQFGIAPQREKHVVVNLADLRHAQKYGVLDQYLDTLDRQTDVISRVGLEVDGFLRDAVDNRPAVLTAPAPTPTVQAAPAEPQFAGVPAPSDQDDSF